MSHNDSKLVAGIRSDIAQLTRYYGDETQMRLKVTRLLCVLCKKLEKKTCLDISHDVEGDLISRDIEVWWKKHKKNCRCWKRENKRARDKRELKLKKKIEKELQGLDKRTKAYRRAKRPSSEATQKLVGS